MAEGHFRRFLKSLDSEGEHFLFILFLISSSMGRTEVHSGLTCVLNFLACHSNVFSSVQSLSHVQLCKPHGLERIRLPAHHLLPELAQTHVHQVSDAIEPSHPLSSPSPTAFNLPQHQGLF